MSSKVIVVDLDGTLLNTNTFHRWLIFLFKKSLLHSPLDSINILFIFTLRILKIISHKQMKYKILKISESKKYVKYISYFVEELHIYLNREVLEYIKEENVISILATAAPALYAENIANKYVFNYCIATPTTSVKPWYENIRDNKKTSLENIMNELNLEKVDTVLSDHHDDLPIMTLAEKVFLVNSSAGTENILRDNKLNYFKISNIAL